MICFDTDVLSVLLLRVPPAGVVRRLALCPVEEQCTTAVTVAELAYGAAKRGSAGLDARVRELLQSALRVVPFDNRAARVYGPLRAQLEREGRRLEEADLQIASIALARDLTLVTGNVRHFARVPGLRFEDWLAA